MLPPPIASERWKPRVSASYVVVAGTLLGFALISSFSVGVPGRFRDLAGGRAPAPEMARCVALSYRGIGDRQLPTSLRLTGDVESFGHARGGPLYRATSESGGGWKWRPAGPDSIDVMSDYQPMIRFPARGERVTGRVGPRGYYMMWGALFGGPDGQVFAREVRCPPFVLEFID